VDVASDPLGVSGQPLGVFDDPLNVAGHRLGVLRDRLGAEGHPLWTYRQSVERPEFSISFSRSFKDADGKWQRTHSLSIRDLPHLKLAVDWALHELLLKDG